MARAHDRPRADHLTRQGHPLRDLVEESPAFLAGRPDGHCRAEIALGAWRFQRRGRNPFTYLHVQLCETHR